MAETKELSSEMRFCIACGAANPAGETLCFACQQPLTDEQEEPVALLHGRYHILTRLGSGGFGAVYRAEDTREKRIVAIKQIRIRGLTASEAIEATAAFHREVEMLSRLHHSQLPRIYDHFTDPEHWYLVTDFIEGETLASYADKRRSIQNNTPFHRALLPLPEVLDIGLQLCDVLEYLHSQQPPVIFRDLKPGNVMRTLNGHLFLIDFGIARYFNPSRTQDTIPFGSPGYAAPEQYGKAQTTQRSDIYSLGAVLHELLTGDDPAENPFHFAPLHSYAGEGWSQLETLLMSMIEVDAGKRPASIGEVRAVLEQIAASTGSMLSSGAHTWAINPVSPLPLQQQVTSQQSSSVQRQQQQPIFAPSSSPVASARSRLRFSRRQIIAGLGMTALAAGGVSLFSWYSNVYRSRDHLLYTFQKHAQSEGRYHNVPTLSWSPSGNFIASGDAGGSLRVWQATTGDELFVQHLRTLVTAVCWSPGGLYIASGSRDGLVRFWLRPGSQVLESYTEENRFDHGISAIAWATGNLVAAADDFDTIRIWRVAGDEDRLLLKQVGVRNLEWSPDGNFLLVSSFRGITTYRVSTAPLAASPQKLSPGIADQLSYTAKWSPDGTQIAAVSASGHAVLIRRKAGTIYTCSAPGNIYPIHSLTWSPDSKYLAGAFGDQVLIWHVPVEKLIYTYRGHDSYVSVVAWSPNGDALASSDVNGVVQVWRAETE